MRVSCKVVKTPIWFSTSNIAKNAGDPAKKYAAVIAANCCTTIMVWAPGSEYLWKLCLFFCVVKGKEPLTVKDPFWHKRGWIVMQDTANKNLFLSYAVKSKT